MCYIIFVKKKLLNINKIDIDKKNCQNIIQMCQLVDKYDLNL